MLEIRFHGRGGQGTVVAAKIIAEAVLNSGRGQCLAIPEFGVERRGAPVLAYARISEKPIRVRSRIYEPDAVVLLDPAFAASPAVTAGLKPDGLVIVNSELPRETLAARWPGRRVIAVPARRIALTHGLGTPASPLVNTAICGALCAILSLADWPALEQAVREAVPAAVERNLAATREAFEVFREAARAAR
ncbi:MAG: 2-oxoacid:acceptor oxidoreductase family protein [Elusimicrobia bacterium]|nr:2-oxoacid:acceptor oxidoreductase family protein [Elusimicrobiota bacterium]